MKHTPGEIGKKLDTIHQNVRLMDAEIERLKAQNAAMLEALRGIHAISRIHKTPTEVRIDRIMPMAEAAITAATD